MQRQNPALTGRSRPHQDGKATPSPDAFDADQTRGSHPQQLVLNRRQPIFRIVCRASNGSKEVLVLLLRRRPNDFKVEKPAARLQLTGDLREESLLSIVLEVMDRKPGHDQIEAAKGLYRIP